MESPAQRQAEVQAQVRAIARAIYEEIGWPGQWDRLGEDRQETWCIHTRALLRSGVFRLPRRSADEPPLEGQTTIDEQLDAIEREAQGR